MTCFEKTGLGLALMDFGTVSLLTKTRLETWLVLTWS